MSQKPDRKEVKIGVKEGDGPPPGYRWNVEILDVAFNDAMSFLDEEQYDHIAAQVRELAGQTDPSHSDTIDVKPIEDFYEVRDKGGILGKKNTRVFFFINKNRRAIVVLGAFKKEAEGSTPAGIRLRMRRRKRLYLEKYSPLE